LDVKGSNLETNKLESKDLNVESEVLNTSLKQKVETFKLVDNVKGNVDKEDLEVRGNVTLFSHKVDSKDNKYQENVKSNVIVKEEAKIDRLDILSSNVDLNNGEINNLNVRTQELNNKVKENSYSGGLNLKGSVGVTGVSVGASINVNNINTKKDSKVHEESNVSLRGNSKIEENLDATNINLTYDNLVVNADNVNFRAIKDEENIVENETGINLGINISASSPIVKDALNIGKGVKNLLEGRIDKAISNISNGYVGAVDDLSGN
ncbi:hypothetical protein HP397_06735, partial [Streptobacillus felis]